MRAEIKLFVLNIDPDNMSTFHGVINSTGDADVAQRAVYASAKSFQETLFQSTPYFARVNSKIRNFSASFI
jgi:hypothetical protein